MENFAEARGVRDSNLSIGNRYMFTAREWDSETQLYYYRARYYDAGVGRFLSEDPIGFKGGINFYSYVQNNPLSFIDPFGLKVVCKEISRTKDIVKKELVDKKVEKGLWTYREAWLDESIGYWILNCAWSRYIQTTYTYLITELLTIIDQCTNTCTGETWKVKMTGYQSSTKTEIKWKEEKRTTQKPTAIPFSLATQCMQIKPAD